ncbi:MAG: penicillin-binding transpeptidase domain-containing protein, partial [Actinomycetota bacterium]|nr:penicillin-binding transpeptidase domain-containing protein [Actinomycetota bacterium]
PSLYAGRVNPRKLADAGLTDREKAEAANFPGLNRAIAGEYPPGSTFKPVTALAAMQEHLLQPYDYLTCTSSITIAGQPFNNWKPSYEAMDLPRALEESCDTFFYQLGYAFYRLPGYRGQPLQRWARRFGFGQTPGLDIGGQSSGILPTYRWKQETFKGDPVEETWLPGNSIQLSIGQQYLRVTPLQMARFYALIANGGHLVRPHVAEQAGVLDNRGRFSETLWRFTPRPPGPPLVDPQALRIVKDGLFQATHGVYGTATAVFGDYPIPIAGKTGTAEMVVDGQMRDQSWWCGYGPAENARLVVCAVIENGGHGGTAAAPAAFEVFQEFFKRPAEVEPATNSD